MSRNIDIVNVDGDEIADAMFSEGSVGVHSASTAPDAVVTLTPPAGATMLWIQVEEKAIRITVDNTNPDPTATPPVGFLLKPEDGVRSIRVNANTVIKYRRAEDGAVVQRQWRSS